MIKIKEDITGQKYGYLTVLYRVNDYISSKGNKESCWHCKCKCGNELDVTKNALKSGNTQSCGCKRKETIHNSRFQDLTNKRFGRLTVLYQKQGENNKFTMWHCKCDCGKEKDVRSSSLLNGKTQSCGCIQKEKIKQINKDLKAYDENNTIIKKYCPKCGYMKNINNFYKNKAGADGYHSICKQCYNFSEEGRYNIYKKGAKRRKLCFNLSLEDFKTITYKPCFYCGEYSRSYLGKYYSGVDRIDSSVGYIKENCVPCCGFCNKMKMDFTQDEWLKQIEKIYKYVKNEEKNEQ